MSHAPRGAGPVSMGRGQKSLEDMIEWVGSKMSLRKIPRGKYIFHIPGVPKSAPTLKRYHFLVIEYFSCGYRLSTS